MGPVLTIQLLVLNPAIRMSWIRRQWGEPYIMDAETEIKKTVGDHQICSIIILIMNTR
jgi:hypothetical protein